MIDDAFTPAENQRHRCFDFFADERSFPPCFARLTIPTHTECRDRWGSPCHPRDLECAHLIGVETMENRIDGMQLTKHRWAGHPILKADRDAVVYDWRNAVPLCPAAHHSWDKSGKRPALADLPEHFKDFLLDWQIWHWAEALYPSSGEMELAA